MYAKHSHESSIARILPLLLCLWIVCEPTNCATQLALRFVMRWSVTNRVTNLAVATGVSLLTAQFYPRNLDGYAPALAEVICWSLVTVSFGFSSRFVPGLWKNENFGLKPSIKYLYWIVAGSVSMVAALSSVIDSTWVTVGFSCYLLTHQAC